MVQQWFYGGEGNHTYIINFYTFHTHSALWCGTIRPNGNVFYECPLLWMCDSDWEADRLQHPAKCQSHGGHKWLWAHCCDTLGTLSSRPAIYNQPRRSGVEQLFGSGLIVWSSDRCVAAALWTIMCRSLLRCVLNFVNAQRPVSLSTLSLPTGVIPEMLNQSPVAFTVGLQKRRVCVHVSVCVLRG